MKTTKRIIAGVLSVTLMCGSLALPAAESGITLFDTAITADAETYGDYEYVILDDGTIEISKYIGEGGKVIIPAKINGKKVTKIGDHSFCFCRNVESVTIPDGVKTIGGTAFRECTLSEVIIPDSVKTIESAAFIGCASLDVITIPKSVTSIGENAIGYYAAAGLHKFSDLKIICYTGTAGERYAIENGFKYEYADNIAPIVKMVIPTTFSCSTTAIRINWKKLGNSSGYRIYRKNLTTGKWDRIATLSGNSTTTYRDSGLKPGTKYSYKVKAYLKSGGKTYWGEASKAITTFTRPKAVKFTKISRGTTAIRLKWTKVDCYAYEEQMYNPVTKKWEYFSPGKSEPGKGTSLPTDAVFNDYTEIRVTGLKKNKSYKFRVRPYLCVNNDAYPTDYYYGAWTEVTVRTRA